MSQSHKPHHRWLDACGEMPVNVIKTALKLLPRKRREPKVAPIVAQPQSVSRPSRVSSVSTDVTLCDNQTATELEDASRNLLHFLQLPIGTEMQQQPR